MGEYKKLKKSKAGIINKLDKTILTRINRLHEINRTIQESQEHLDDINMQLRSLPSAYEIEEIKDHMRRMESPLAPVKLQIGNLVHELVEKCKELDY